MYPMYPTIGFGFGDVVNVLNPVNHLKAGWGVVSNPFNPLKQTQAVLNAFRGGRGGAAPSAAPPGYAPQGWRAGGAPAPGWGAPPPVAPSPAMPPGSAWFSPQQQQQQWGAAAPPPSGLSYAPQMPATSTQPWGGFAPPAASTPMYDPNQYLSQTAPPLQQDFGSMDTGWDAAYGGAPGFGW